MPAATFRATWSRPKVLLLLAVLGVLAPLACLSEIATVAGTRALSFVAPSRLAVFSVIAAEAVVLLAKTAFVFWQFVDVGSDGVLLRRAGSRRFVSYRSVAEAQMERHRIALTLLSGEPIVLYWWGQAGAGGPCAAAFHRIQEARAAFFERHGTQRLDTLLQPGGRKVGRWMSDVRGLTSGHGYRETGIGAGRLGEIVDDASAAPIIRAGAALAISRLDEASRSRIRVAAEASAQPELRAALLRVAEGAPDRALATAFAPLLERGQA